MTFSIWPTFTLPVERHAPGRIGKLQSCGRNLSECELPYIESAYCLQEMGLESEATALLSKAVDLIPEAIREARMAS